MPQAVDYAALADQARTQTSASPPTDPTKPIDYAALADQVRGTSVPAVKPAAKIGPQKSPWWDVSKTTLLGTGAMLGAEQGMAMGAPGGPVGVGIGGVAGAAIGAFGGESIQMALETLARKLGAKGLQPITPTGATSRLTEAGRTAAYGQMGAEALLAVGRPLLRPFVGKLQPYAKEAVETFKTTKGRSAVLPSEISKSSTLGLAENIAEGSLFGGGGAAATRETRQSLAETRVLGVLDSLGTKTTATKAGQAVQAKLPVSPAAGPTAALSRMVQQRAASTAARGAESEMLQQAGEKATSRYVDPSVTSLQAGQSVRTARATAIKAFRHEEKQVWGEYERLTDQIPMRSPKLDAFLGDLGIRHEGRVLPNAGLTAAQRVAELTTGAQQIGATNEMVRIGGAVQDVRSLPANVREAVSRAMETTAPSLTARQFQKTVSDLGKLTRALEQSAKTDPSKYNAQLGLAKKVYELAKTDLQDVLREVSPEAAQAYDTATTLSHLGNEQLFNEEVRKIVRQAPEKVTATLLRPNNSTAIKMTTEAVGADAMAPVRRVALNQILAVDPVTKQVPWRAVLRRVATLGDDTGRALFPQGELDGVKRIAESVVDAQRLLSAESKAEVGALVEARATVKAAKSVDPFQPFRKTAPEKLTGQLFQKDNVTAVRAIKSLVGEEGFKPVQWVAMDRVLAADPKTGAIDWGTVVKRLDRLDAETLREFFPGGQADEVKRVAGLMLKLSRANQTGGVLKWGVKLSQWGVAAGALGGQLPPAAGTILLGPAAISRIFSSQTGLRWLSVGLQAPPWSPSAVRAVSQLTAFLMQSAQEDKKRQPQGAAGSPAEAK